MSKYLFKMSDYHAVKNADIKIDGITVLSGENGSGKSTLLRWLHYVVKVLCEYEGMVENEAKRKLKDIYESLRTAFTVIRNNQDDELKIQEIISLISIEKSEWESAANIITRFREAVIIFSSLLQKQTNGDSSAQLRINRLYNYFNIEKPEKGVEQDIAARLSAELNKRLDFIEEERNQQLNNHSINNLVRFLSSQVDPMVERLRDHLSVDFIEDEVNLIDRKGFESPLNLSRSIYFGTERIGNALEPIPYGKNELRYMLRNKAPHAASTDSRTIGNVIKGIIGGEIVSDKIGDKYGFMSNELRFKNNTGLDIHLKGAATGIISFAYILRLLDNGWITRDSILIIDEPEAHLHPQWIVEYARMLVLLHKHLGTKIVVASHNPDMVAAIEAVASSENLLETTNFYIAERHREEKEIAPRYTYKDCGSDIAPIFDSFNIALERINLYSPSL